jgi:pyrroline-5-carboxylate reductase
MRVAVLGAGKIGEALLAGLLAAGWAPDDLVLTERHPDRAAELHERLGVRAVDTPAAAEHADVVVIAVKPQDIVPVLGALAAALRPGTPVVSLCAGVPLAVLEGGLPAGTPVVRVMPNTPMLVGEAMSAGVRRRPRHRRAAGRRRGAAAAVGRVVRVPETSRTPSPRCPARARPTSSSWSRP